MEGDIKSVDLSDTIKVFTWNRRCLSIVGIWPLKVYDPIFLFSFVYLIIHCVLGILDLANYSKNFDLIVANVTENMVMLNALIKMTICRFYRDSLAQFLIKIRNDFKVESYKSREEILTFFGYNRLSYLFSVTSLCFMSFISVIYFLRSLVTNLQMVMDNSSFGYQLPYKTRSIIEINDTKTYALHCLYQVIVLPLITFGSIGYDSFFITLSLHVTAQLSVLKHRVKLALDDPDGFRCGMKKLINKHYQLIGLVDTLENAFNLGILEHLLGTTFNLCVSGYNAILHSSNGETLELFLFFIFSSIILSTLFVYCYTGECLIQESSDFAVAFYEYEWYNISPKDLKMILISMIGASKPLQLTSGKFFVLSLCTFTDILKTSMGYLSVLRTDSVLLQVKFHERSLLSFQDRVDSYYAIKVLTWNKRLLCISGIWPLQVRDSIFLSYLIYGCLIEFMSFLALFDNLSDFDYISTSLTENILMFITLTKMITCRINSRSIGRFLKEVQRNVFDENYGDEEERSIFRRYNKLSYRFVTINVPMMTVILVSYFVNAALTSALLVMSNSTLEYQLPYKIKPIVKPHDSTSFLFGCLYQFLCIPMIVSGYVGIDCLFTSSAFHVTARFAILKHRITKSLKDCERDVREIIVEHCHLIGLAETLEDNFTGIIFQQLLGTTLQLCISGYHMLVYIANNEDVQAMVFLMHVFGLSSTLFVYCYIGECLIQESTNLNEAFYDIKWYEMLTKNLKTIYVCMIRTRKPLQLTSAKFCALSLCTFTDILKTSMGYLSATDLFEGEKVIRWNKRLLKCVGVWPLAVYDPLFLFFVIYLLLHCSLTFVDFIDQPKNIDYVVRVLTETVPLLMALIKITIYRVNRRSIAQLLIEIHEDFSVENYANEKEKLIFLDYNRLSCRFTAITFVSMSIVTGLYFFKAIMTSVLSVMGNSSLEYQLPYKTRTMVELNDITTYAFYCIYQWLIVLTMISGYVGSDCLFASLALHVTGQLAILRCKVKEAFEDSNGYKRGMKKLVIKHHRLIKLVETLEDGYNIMIFQQLLGTTLNLCVSGYHALVSSANGENIILVTFFVYAFSVLSTLFVYCYIGECLIEESTGLGDTLYQSDWYDMSTVDLKMMYICMQRTRKPLQLTSAKFCALSLYTFSDVDIEDLGGILVRFTSISIDRLAENI
ncbi:odorant receptor 9a-like [Vespula squamosa]|uniref:Odorant receptor 9a-like n=1 Tax=Vespula squamosa TaxID=30214 RepID=A0ABD1ZYP0_VESSQ